MKRPTKKKPPAQEPMLWAWRVVNPDFTSRGSFKWPFPGNWCEAPGPIVASNRGPCPNNEGDGVCLAKDWYGAASGGITARAILVCGYYEADVLGQDEHKLRVRRAYVADLWSAEELVTARGASANLNGANLNRASLDGASLDGASLDRANLNGASLDRANLNGANLNGANLNGASLNRASLNGASLNRASLDGANLNRANLNGANLNRASLDGANLNRASLNGASLNGASYCTCTRWPDNYKPDKNMTKVKCWRE